jgi:hypothetical protein
MRRVSYKPKSIACIGVDIKVGKVDLIVVQVEDE